MNNYKKFLIMVLTATVIMYGLMYLNTYAWDHVFFSQTRLFMTLIMGAVMAIVMLLFMRNMYTNKRANTGIIVGSLILFALSFWLVRSQTIVADISYMRAMIPHHSIAILTSERADIKDPRVREIADEIIEAQVREIAEMKELLADLEGKQ